MFQDKDKKRVRNLSPKKAKQLLDLNKKEQVLVIGLFTRHYQLRYHLKVKLDRESCYHKPVDHLLCECQALFCKKLKFLKRLNLTHADI